MYGSLFYAPVSITTKVVSSIPAYGEVYSMQQYVIKFVGDLRQVGGFLQVLRFPPPIKLTATMQLKIVESGFKHYNTKLLNTIAFKTFVQNWNYVKNLEQPAM